MAQDLTDVKNNTQLSLKSQGEGLKKTATAVEVVSQEVDLNTSSLTTLSESVIALTKSVGDNTTTLTETNATVQTVKTTTESNAKAISDINTELDSMATSASIEELRTTLEGKITDGDTQTLTDAKAFTTEQVSTLATKAELKTTDDKAAAAKASADSNKARLDALFADESTESGFIDAAFDTLVEFKAAIDNLDVDTKTAIEALASKTDVEGLTTSVTTATNTADSALAKATANEASLVEVNTSLSGKAPINNPVFNGTVTVTAPTDAKHAATKEYVDAATAAASKVIAGSGVYAGITGVEVPVEIEGTFAVSVTSTGVPDGSVGEVSVVKGTKKFTVYNTGAESGTFDYMVTKL